MLSRPYRSLGDTPAAAAAPPTQTAEPYIYVFDFSLTANQVAQDQSRNIDKDSDFLLYSIYGTQTGLYLIQLYSFASRAVTSSAIRNDNFVGNCPFPNPVLPALLYPRGSRIPLDLYDKSGALNTIQLCFKGVRLFDRKQ